MPAILVVKDSSDLALAIQRDLEKEGYQVSIAADGKEALVLFEQLSPDLIILDWMLPGMDGLEVLAGFVLNLTSQ